MRHILLLFIAFALVACGGASSPKKQVAAQTDTVQSDVTEVLYFHGKKRCITCNAIEKLAKEVVDSLASDKLVLRIIDISQESNKDIIDKYEVTWSSLILQRGDKSDNLTKMGFGYAKNEPEQFKAKLVEAVNNIAK